MSIENEAKRIQIGIDLANAAIVQKGGTAAENIDGLATAIANIPEAVDGPYGTVVYYSKFNITWDSGYGNMPIVDNNKFNAVAAELIDSIPYDVSGGMGISISGEYRDGQVNLRSWTMSGEKSWTGTGAEAGIDTSRAESEGFGYGDYRAEQIQRAGTSEAYLTEPSDIQQLVAEVYEEYGNPIINLDKVVTLTTGESFAYGYIKEFKFGPQFTGTYPDYFLCAYELTDVSGCGNVRSVGDHFMNWIMPRGGGEIWEPQLTSCPNFTNLTTVGDCFMAGFGILPTSFPALTTVGNYFGTSEMGGMGGGYTTYAVPSFPELVTVGNRFLYSLYSLRVENDLSFPKLKNVGEYFMAFNENLFQNYSNPTISFGSLETTGDGMFGWCTGWSGGLGDVTIELPALVTLHPGLFDRCSVSNLTVKIGPNFAAFGEAGPSYSSPEDSKYFTGGIGQAMWEIYTDATNPPTDLGIEECFSTKPAAYGDNNPKWNPCVVKGSQVQKFLDTYPNDSNHYRWFITEEQYNSGEY